jgi:hypothetical protein
MLKKKPNPLLGQSAFWKQNNMYSNKEQTLFYFIQCYRINILLYMVQKKKKKNVKKDTNKTTFD